MGNEFVYFIVIYPRGRGGAKRLCLHKGDPPQTSQKVLTVSAEQYTII